MILIFTVVCLPCLKDYPLRWIPLSTSSIYLPPIFVIPYNSAEQYVSSERANIMGNIGHAPPILKSYLSLQSRLEAGASGDIRETFPKMDQSIHNIANHQKFYTWETLQYRFQLFAFSILITLSRFL